VRDATGRDFPGQHPRPWGRRGRWGTWYLRCRLPSALHRRQQHQLHIDVVTATSMWSWCRYQGARADVRQGLPGPVRQLGPWVPITSTAEGHQLPSSRRFCWWERRCSTP